MPHVATLKSLLREEHGVPTRNVNQTQKGPSKDRQRIVQGLPLLTMPERRIFDAVRSLNKSGIRPSYRDVAMASGLRPGGYIHGVIMALEEAGYVTTGAVGERRAICVTPAGWSA